MNTQNCFIVIDRVSEFKNKHRAYSIYLNGEKISKIKNGERVELKSQPGIHQIWVKFDWIKSDLFEINLTELETKYIEVSNLSNWKSKVGLICCGVFAGFGAMLFGAIGAGVGGGIGGAIYGTFACKPQLREKKI